MMEDEPLNGELLVESLSALKKKLERSGLDRTFGLKESMGSDCAYYWKSLNSFLKQDYKELRDLVNNAKKWFDKIEEELNE